MVHQPGSWTPNPAVPSVGAAVLRNRCASSVSNVRSEGRAVRSARSRSGYSRPPCPARPGRSPAVRRRWRASAGSLPRERQTASASTTRLGSSAACSPNRTCQSSSSSTGSTSRKQARTGPATASRCHSASPSESTVTSAASAANTRSPPVSALSQARVTAITRTTEREPEPAERGARRRVDQAVQGLGPEVEAGLGAGREPVLAARTTPACVPRPRPLR